MTAQSRRRFLIRVGLIALILVLNLLFISYYFRGPESEVARAELTRDLSGGVPIQRRRIDRFIETTAPMSFDDAARSLNEYTEGYELAMQATLAHGTVNPGVILLEILADRRVAKLYEMLAQEPKRDAALKCAALFQEKLRVHVEQTKQFRSGTHPDPVRYMSAVHLHAATAALFLCAHFCDKKTFLACLDKWHAEFPGDSRSMPGVIVSGLPETLFELNMLLLILEKEGTSRAELNTWLAELGTQFGFEQATIESVPFYKWNAHTNNTDFTHIHRFVPTDDEALLMEIPGFRNWPYGKFVGIAEVQEDVIAAVRTRLE
jgi:hypothetical protein